MTVDSTYYSTGLQLHGAGLDTSTTFTDTSQYAHVVTALGNAQIDTAQQVYVGSSMLFDGTGDGLSVANHASLLLAGGDYSIVFRIRFNSKTGYQTIASKGYGVANGWLLQTGNGDGRLNFYQGAGSTVVAAESAGTINTGQWYHIALEHYNGVLTIYRDGVPVASGADTTNYSATSTLYIGGGSGTGFNANYFNGWLEDFEIKVGVATYTAPFTPPTSALPDGIPPVPLGEFYLIAPMATVQVCAGSVLDLTAALPTMQAFTGAQADLAAPMGEVSANCGGGLVLCAPLPTLWTTGHDSSGENELSLTAPLPTLQALGGATARVTAPLATLIISGTGTAVLRASLSAPMVEVSASGYVSSIAQAELTAPLATMVGYGGALISVTTPMGTITASGISGAVGSIEVTCPLFELVAQASANAHASAELIAPVPTLSVGLQAWLVAPMAQLVAIGSATVTASYEAYALNLLSDAKDMAPYEVTHYTNFPFTRIVRYKNSYFGMAADGLYLLEGTTDFDAAAPSVPKPIVWSWRTALTDFESVQKKTVVSAYFNGRLPPAATITHYVGETGADAYSFATTRGAGAQNYRQTFGRGAKDRFHAFGASGTGTLELASIEFNVATLTRRI